MRFVGIDLSTKTGFVALDEAGNVLVAKQIEGIGDIDPKRMTTMIQEIKAHLRKSDIITIEGLPFASQQAIQMGGIGWGVRMLLYSHGVEYLELPPLALKKFCGASGFAAERNAEGKKVRLKGKDAKKQMRQAVSDKWGFDHNNDNIVDAYGLAQWSRAEYFKERG